MTMTNMKAIAAAALIGTAALTMSVPAEAGRGYYGHSHGGNAWGAGLVGFGIGALVGTALAPSTVYVAPPAGSRLLRPGGLWASTMEPSLVRLLPQPAWPLLQPEYGLLPGR